jgi:hypothetical protein
MHYVLFDLIGIGSGQTGRVRYNHISGYLSTRGCSGRRSLFQSGSRPASSPSHIASTMSAVPASDGSIDAKRGAFHEIPIIDFADAFGKDLEKRKAVAATIYDACVRVGFFYVKNHGVDDLVMTNVFGAAKDFFNLPLKDKMEIDLNKSSHFRGYTKLMVIARHINY